MYTTLEEIEMITYVLLILGFILLIKGADLFVTGSSSIAKLLKIPSIIIGLTIVALGTSMPEASVSVNAAITGKNELAISNVIGSNIFNLLMVMGICSIINPMSVQKSILKKEFPFSALITVLLLIFSVDKLIKNSDGNILSQVEGGILLLVFIVFLLYTIYDALKSRKQNANSETEDYKVISPLKSVIFIFIGIAGIIFGGNLIVESASQIAASFGISQTLIGLTIVAIGTSLPELVTSVVAAKKGESDIAIGNAIGSNIFNILFILGASAFIHPIAVNLFTIYDIIILIAASLIAYFFAIGRRTVDRIEGSIMVTMYLAFSVFIIVR